MKNDSYKKEQYGILLNFLLTFVIVFLILTILKAQEKGAIIVLSASLFFVMIIWLLTYKLTILMDNGMISAIFGIGLLKRKIALKDIDLKTLQVVTPSKLTGIGIRLTPKGWLWNVKFGKAIYFKTKTGKVFFVGTDDAEKITNRIKSQIS